MNLITGIISIILVALGAAQPQNVGAAKVSDAPKLIGVVEEINNPEDTNTTITCSVGSGDLQGLSFEWFKDKERLYPQLGKIRIDTPQDNYISALRIFNLKPSDTGLYSCLAKNRFGQDKISTRLNVKVQLKWLAEPTSREVSVGRHVHIPCKADGNPKPGIEWRRIDGQTNSTTGDILGPELSFSSVQQSDAGDYECRASNGAEEDLVSRIKLQVLAVVWAATKNGSVLAALASSQNLRANEATCLQLDNFSIKSFITSYQNGQHKSSVRTYERYSSIEQRAVIEVDKLDNLGNEQKKNNNNDKRVYYHDAKASIWLRKSHGEQCLRTGSREFEADLFSSETLPLSDFDEETGSYVVGSAKFLLLAKRIAADLSKRPEHVQVRGINATLFKGQVPGLKDSLIEVLYARENLDIFDDDECEEPVRINFTWEDAKLEQSTTLVINYYEFKRLHYDYLDESFSGEELSFLFPLGVGCGQALAAGQEEVDGFNSGLQSMDRLEFKARISKSKSDSELNINEQEVDFTFNLRAKLMRRDAIIRRATNVLRSSTIYDFRSNIKYNSITEFSDHQAANNNETVLFVEGSTSSGACFMDKIIVNQTEDSYKDFIRFRRLQFMGLTRVNAIEARVYEDDGLERLPFWLSPSVAISGQLSGKILSSESDLSIGPTGHIVMVYYFSSSQQPGRLLRIDALQRDLLRNTLVLKRKLQVLDFRSDRITKDSLALSSICTSSNLAQSSEVALLLERRGQQGDLSWMRELESRFERNEALAEALNSDFRLPQTHIDQLESETSAFSPSIRLEFRARNSAKEVAELECTRLGRGEFLMKERVSRFHTFAFEDCIWLSNYQARILESELVFAYDIESSTCLLDKLYKYRDIHGHEAAIAMSNTVRSLNYFPYDYGQYVMYKSSVVQQQRSRLDDHELITRAVVSFGELNQVNLIGRQLILRLGDHNSELKLDYRLKHVKVSGHLSHNSLRRIKGLGWCQTGKEDSLIRQVQVPKLGPSSCISEAKCRNLCLVDHECNSYSYCESPSGSGEQGNECHLSKLDLVDEAELMPKLSYILESSNQLDVAMGRTNRLRQVTVNGTKQQEVTVRLGSGCSIVDKSYNELFEKTHQTKVSLDAKQQKVISGANLTREDCAKACFRYNLDFLRGLLRHKQDMDSVQRDLLDMISNEEKEPVAGFYLDRLDSALNWRREQLKNLCSNFMFAPQRNSSSTLNVSSVCIISGQAAITEPPVKMPPEEAKLIPMMVHKLLFVNLYERMAGFRLAQSNEQPEVGGQGDRSLIGNYSKWLRFHQSGRNSQVKLLMDQVEYCARACTLQAHGPRPACVSFDYVNERAGSNRPGGSYCLLNSQSVHDLKRRQLRAGANLSSEEQIVYTNNSVGLQFWHFEPRESLLLASANDHEQSGDEDDEDDDDGKLLDWLNNNQLIKSLELLISESGHKGTNSKNSSVVVLILILAAATTGLFMGVKLARYRIERLENERDEITLKNRVIRVVHRLSGVSLSLTLDEREVRM